MPESLFNKVAGLRTNFIKKEALAQILFCEFCEISQNSFFTEHLRATASEDLLIYTHKVLSLFTFMVDVPPVSSNYSYGASKSP